MIRVILTAWDRCTWMIKPCLESLQSHWLGMPENVTVITNDPGAPVPNYAEMYVTPDWQPRHYSGRLMDVLRTCSEPVIFIASVDMFLLNNVSNEKMALAAQYIVEKGNVFQVGVRYVESLEKHRKTIEQWKGLDIIQCAEPRHCAVVGMAWGHAFHSSELLLSLLENFWTIWECEAYTTKKVQERKDITAVGIYPALFETTDLCWTNAGRNYSAFQHLDQLTENDRLLVEAAMPPMARWT